MRFTSTTRKVYAAGIAVAIALAVLRTYGLTVADIARMARAKFTDAAADAKAVTSREYADRVSRSLREEAARYDPVEPRPAAEGDFVVLDVKWMGTGQEATAASEAGSTPAWTV